MSSTMAISHYIDDSISDIIRRKSNIGCLGKTGLLYILQELGFSHRAGKNDNHRVFTHPKLSEKNSAFTTFGVDCGHGMKKTVLSCYPDTVLKVLKNYREELKEIFDEKNDS